MIGALWMLSFTPGLNSLFVFCGEEKLVLVPREVERLAPPPSPHPGVHLRRISFLLMVLLLILRPSGPNEDGFRLAVNIFVGFIQSIQTN